MVITTQCDSTCVCVCICEIWTGGGEGGKKGGVSGRERERERVREGGGGIIIQILHKHHRQQFVISKKAEVETCTQRYCTCTYSQFALSKYSTCTYSLYMSSHTLLNTAHWNWPILCR